MVGFSGSLLALALGSGFCETENTLDRKDRVANRSRHHVDQRTKDGKEDKEERMKETKNDSGGGSMGMPLSSPLTMYMS